MEKQLSYRKLFVLMLVVIAVMMTLCGCSTKKQQDQKTHRDGNAVGGSLYFNVS